MSTKQQVEFFTGDDGDAYWRVTDADGKPVNRSSEGFRKLGSAKNNLLIFHTLLSADLMALVNGNDLQNISLYEDDHGKYRWNVRASNGEIVGASHKGFDNGGASKNNLLMTYALISTYIASVALGR